MYYNKTKTVWPAIICRFLDMWSDFERFKRPTKECPPIIPTDIRWIAEYRMAAGYSAPDIR